MTPGNVDHPRPRACGVGTETFAGRAGDAYSTASCSSWSRGRLSSGATARSPAIRARSARKPVRGQYDLVAPAPDQAEHESPARYRARRGSGRLPPVQRGCEPRYPGQGLRREGQALTAGSPHGKFGEPPPPPPPAGPPPQDKRDTAKQTPPRRPASTVP